MLTATSMQKISDELIDKFLKGLCTSEEAVQVECFLRENPAHPFLVREWDTTETGGVLPGNYTQGMYDAINTVIARPAGMIPSWVWKSAIAACLTGLVLALFFFEKTTTTAPAAIAKVGQNADAGWTTERNEVQKNKVVMLSDGSRITLSPQATVRYHTEFNATANRDIHMSGRAFFEVAKNKKRPFIVYSGEISTTALGTAFMVNAPAQAAEMHVKLFEGKVLIQVAAGLHTAQHYYLLPGEEFVLTADTGDGIVKRFIEKNGAGRKAKKKTYPSEEAGTSYMFNNQTLADVLDELSLMYRTDIQYPKAAIGNSYFIGKIDREDSLEKIINDIAILNQLTVTKNKSGFILRKK